MQKKPCHKRTQNELHLFLMTGPLWGSLFSFTTVIEASVSGEVMDEFWETPIERQANKCAMIEPPPGTDISTIGAHTIRRPIAKANKSNEDPGQISFSHLFIPYAEPLVSCFIVRSGPTMGQWSSKQSSSTIITIEQTFQYTRQPAIPHAKTVSSPNGTP